jgi:hypothetical protein
MDSVPTTVVKGPDGAYYIGELTGMPFTNERANIYRLDPETDAIPHAFTKDEAFLTGFKTIIDMAFDQDGTLYVLQYSSAPPKKEGAPPSTGMGLPGILIRIVPDKSKGDLATQYRSGVRTTVLAGLPTPTSVVVGPDGELYLSIRGISNGAINGGGEVIRFTPQP